MDKLRSNTVVLRELMAEFTPSRPAVLCASAALPEWQQRVSAGHRADAGISCHTSTDTLLSVGPDLVYVCEPDAWATTRQAVQNLGYLRDHVQGVVVVYQPALSHSPATVSLSRTDFFALGYQECASASPDPTADPTPDHDRGTQVVGPQTAGQHYLYSLSHYKTPPAWLNAKYWANPERWDLDDDMAIGP